MQKIEPLPQFTVIADDPSADPAARVWRLWNEDPGSDGNPATSGWLADSKPLAALIPLALRLAAAGHTVVIDSDNNA